MEMTPLLFIIRPKLDTWGFILVFPRFCFPMFSINHFSKNNLQRFFLNSINESKF